MNNLFPLVATSRTGETLLLYDVDAFRTFARGKTIEEHFSAWCRVFNRWLGVYEFVERDSDWIVRDDAGRVVTGRAFDVPHPREWPRRRGDFEYRNGPVPGIRGHHGRLSQSARKRHGGRGVAARIRAFHTGPVDRHDD